MKAHGRRGARALGSLLAGAMIVTLNGATAAAQTVAITGGTVYPVSGPKIENGTVIIRDGRIVQVGAGLAAPAGARVIDARGKWVTPGLIHASTIMGLEEVSSITDTRETSQSGSINAAFSVVEGLAPAATTIGVARAQGITSAFTRPSDGLIAGQGAIIALHGDRTDEMVRRASAGLVINFGAAGRDAGGGSRAGAMAKLRELFADAVEYDRRRADYNRNAMRPLSASPEDLDAILAALQGRLLVVARADRKMDLENALRIAREFRLRMVIEGAAEGWMIAPALAASGFPVLVETMRDVPRWEGLNARLDNATILRAAGVNIVIAQNDRGRDRGLRWGAGNGVRNGLTWDEALRGITLAPAQAFGVADQVGSLEAGRIADVVVWSGDPLDFSSLAERVFVGGVETSLTNRQTELRERYRNLPPR
jgi:imidazolonepropionase-like amidohydrolase